MSSDIVPSHNITHISLPDGSIVNINDYVYFAPEHLGEPYYIGRIMVFCTSTKRKGLQARIAWFNRPKDVINRNSADRCLLVATMHSDVNPVSAIRGKCNVVHKQYIPKEELENYRQGEDNFYYTQLYDRYIQRVYDILPTEAVQNVPMETLKVLRERFEFIVVEQGKVADLTVARRTCCVCQEWCESAISVRCTVCHKSYHMACLNPPLTRKPSKGFAWQCAFCTRQELLRLSLDDNDDTTANLPQVSSANTTSLHLDVSAKTANDKQSKHITRQTRSTRSQIVKQKQQLQQRPLPIQINSSEASFSSSTTKNPATVSESHSNDSNCSSIKLKINLKKNRNFKDRVLKMTHMWPFRYFGVNTDVKDVLDVDDRIYPRAKSRMGPKYQAAVPDFIECSSSLVRSLSPNGVGSCNTKLNISNDKKRKSSDLDTCESSSPLSDIRSCNIASSGHTNDNPNKKYKKSLDRKGKSTSPLSQKKSGTASPVNLSRSELLEKSLIPIRGTDETLCSAFNPNFIDSEKLDTYLSLVKELNNLPLPCYSSDMMDKALSILVDANYNIKVALETMKTITKDDFKHLVHWSKKEMDAFEQSIREHGHDLNCAKASVQTKDMADIVRFFYKWKKTDRYEPVYSEWTKIFKPLKKFKNYSSDNNEDVSKDNEEHSETVTDEEEEEEKEKEIIIDQTVVPKSTYATSSYHCMNCHTKSSKIWRRSPSDFDRKQKVFTKVLCNDCGIYWLKYARTKPIDPKERLANATMSYNKQTSISVASKSGKPIASHPTTISSSPSKNIDTNVNNKKRKNPADHVQQKPNVKRRKEERADIEENAKLEHLPCQICSSSDSPELLYTCRNCGLIIHSDCYGIQENKESFDWLCDPCSNQYHPISSYNYECVLCHHGATSQQPLKRTSGYYWAHVQCAAFIPEIKFISTTLMSPVEYIGCVNKSRMEAKCWLCNQENGACVPCSECKKTVHIQCAIENNFKLAFEIVPISSKSSMNCPVISDGLFTINNMPSPSGLMVPQVWCPHHNLSSKRLIDLSTRTNNSSKKSSLKTFIEIYKGVSNKTTPAMRRWCAAKHFTTSKKTHHPKIPNSKEAVMESFNMDDKVLSFVCLSSANTSKSNKNKLTEASSISSSNSIGTKLKNGKKVRISRVCSTEGCQVEHTAIWWDHPEKKDQKICHKCHQSLKEAGSSSA